VLEEVLSRLMGGEESVIWEKYSSTIAGGRPVVAFAAPVTLKAFTIPDGPNKLALNEEAGAQTLINQHFYFRGQSPVVGMDRLTYGGVRFEVRGPEQRLKGNFTYVYGKAVERAPEDSSSV
jgi:hypothetical protein